MSKRFNKNNSQKYVVVHRPHDDLNYYDNDVSGHVLVPASNPNAKAKNIPKLELQYKKKTSSQNDRVGEAVLYGITFDDSKYDYTQHLKPIGLDPENSFFIPAKQGQKGQQGQQGQQPHKTIENLFVEPQYKDAEEKHNVPVFERGVAKPEYLERQQNVAQELTGFRPEMNPALREVLEALEDEAYVVNRDIEVDSKREEQDVVDEDHDVFAQLLQGGEAEDEGEFEDKLDEWDIDNLDDYEDMHYQKEMQVLDNVGNLEDLKNIDYQADVQRFKKEQRREQAADDVLSTGPQSVEPEEEQEEEGDAIGALPSFSQKGKKRKDRQKKGAKSDLTGFSMTSSAIARSETMTVLDDKYDSIISGYENYQDEQEELEDEQSRPFDMSHERPDFENMLDDFLDNYELGKGGREFHKKDQEVERMKLAADEVSRGKLSQRRNRERSKATKSISNSLSSLHI